MSESETGPGKETLTDEQREALGNRFDKMFRTLDSKLESMDGEGMQDGQVVATVVALRKTLSRLGLNFGAVLDMAATGGSSDKMTQMEETLKTFEAANQSLKISEQFLLQENARLERLLRYGQENSELHQSAAKLSPEEFHQQAANLQSMLDRTVTRVEKLLESPDRLRQVRQAQYEASLGEALAFRAPAGKAKGWLVSMMLKVLDSKGYNLTPERLEGMQKLINEQQAALEQSHDGSLVRPLQEIRRFLEGVVLPTLDLSAPDAVPREMFDRAQGQISQLEIDVLTLDQENEALKKERDALKEAEDLRKSFNAHGNQEAALMEMRKENDRLAEFIGKQREKNEELETRVKDLTEAENQLSEKVKKLDLRWREERDENTRLIQTNNQQREEIARLNKALLQKGSSRPRRRGSLLMAGFLGAVLAIPGTVYFMTDTTAPEQKPQAEQDISQKKDRAGRQDQLAEPQSSAFTSPAMGPAQ